MMCNLSMMRIIVSLLSLLWCLVEIHCQPFPHATVMGKTVPNHGYVDFSEVGDVSFGSDNNTVQCHTDLKSCCNSAQGPHRGDWYFPNGTRLDSYSWNIYESRRDKRTDLHRRLNTPAPPTGVYRCDIATNAVHSDTDRSVRDTVYVGLYTARDVMVSGDLMYDPDRLILTCISTDGPATTVTWTRDSTTVITEGTETVLNDPVTAQYTHTLNVTTRGEYTCTVANDKPSSASASFTVTVAGVHVSMNGDIIPNHGYLVIDYIGSTDATALLCNTDRSPYGVGDSGGDWFSPDGTAVGRINKNDVPGFVRNRAPNVVRLLRYAATDPAAEGIYHCSIWDAYGKHELVYVGLYNTGNGDISIESLTVEGGSPPFTLTCISTGGPATIVSWTRDNEPVTEGTETVLVDGKTARYTHRLKITTGGLYRCSVANSKPSHDSDNLSVKGASPPTDLVAVQDGLTGINISWTPPSPLGYTTGYRIDYASTEGSDGSANVNGGNINTLLVTDLTREATYVISITATSEYLPSTTLTVSRIKLVLPPSAPPVVDMHSVKTTTSTITLSWTLPTDATESLVSWELTGMTRRRRGARNAEEGASGRLQGGQNLYTILRLRSGTSYDITVTVFNPAGNSSTSFTHSTAHATSYESSTAKAVLGGVLAVVIVTAVIVLVLVIALFMRKRQAKDSSNAAIELSRVSGKKNQGSDQFQTTSNEAYNVVRWAGRTDEGDYEVLDLPPSTSPSQPPTATVAAGHSVYEHVS